MSKVRAQLSQDVRAVSVVVEDVAALSWRFESAIDEFPITLSSDGLRLTNRGPAELCYEVSDERVSSGLPPGSMPCYAAAIIAVATCCSPVRRAARSRPSPACSPLLRVAAASVRYVSFDEGAAQIVRNLRSVGIELARFQKSGLLKMYSTRTRGPNIEDQFGDLRATVRAHRPRCLVVDPLSALATKLSHLPSADSAQQFLDFLKSEEVTVVNTSLMDGISTDEATATGISTIADTWIHLSYLVQDGERNRALTIVKSRGTGHSNQVRELKLSDEGVTLADVFVAQGKVLMGVARWEWEQYEQAVKNRTLVATDLRLSSRSSAFRHRAWRLWH